jgi:hypothetical protein
MTSTESAKRQALALEAINQAFGTVAGEDGVNLFIEHHLEELPAAYWKEHLNTETPDPKAVLGLLELRSAWGDDDLEYFDFTLPGDVTDYVVSVKFDDEGKVSEISMES